MKKAFWWGLGFIVLIVLIFYFTAKPGKYDEFAQCLTDKGVKMYGAYWCPHCQAQKKLFGSSWDKVNYIECATPGSDAQKEVCNAAGIRTYPTWIFPDENKISAGLSLEQLSSFTDCPLKTEE